MKTLVCHECNLCVANTNNVLARHVRAVHNLEWPDYYVKHELDGEWPVCECGCGEKLLWRKGGFPKFVKGHENKGEQNPMARKKEKNKETQKRVEDIQFSENGWFVNPWTGSEENCLNSIERNFLLHCIKHNDPVTKNHGFKIGWDDTQGLLKCYTPSFKHVDENIIFDLSGFSGTSGQLCLAAVKDWCDEYKFKLLSLEKDEQGFRVVNWYKNQ